MTVLGDLLAAGPAAIDGGLASELEARGHDLTGALWSARLLREDPAAIRDVHATYFAAGATVGISASYQASRSGFTRHGLAAAEADRLLALSVDLVRAGREIARAGGATHPMLVAASVGPYGATLHDGSEYRGHYGVAP
jgi:homocysteine S-methyltransferase